MQYGQQRPNYDKIDSEVGVLLTRNFFNKNILSRSKAWIEIAPSKIIEMFLYFGLILRTWFL